MTIQGAGDPPAALIRRERTMRLARTGDEAEEARAAETLLAEAVARRSALSDTILPGWLSAAILSGEHPLRAARRHAGLDQVDLARGIGVSKAYLSDVESGALSLGAKTLTAAAEVLGVEAEWLAD